MDDADLSDPKTKYDSDHWKSLSPEEFLAVLLHELRNPIAVMQGWVSILSNEQAKEHHATAIASISQKIDVLEKIHQGLGEYIREHGQSPAP